METNNINPKLEQALGYLEIGWSVIPVGEKKKPLEEWKHRQTEKATPEDVRNWFKKYPNANIGVVTGRISNIVVIDIDPRHGGKDDDFKGITTVTVKTGGGGKHYYFKYEEDIENKAAIKEGIDLRGEGGYVVVPPSDHESGNKYEWINNPKDTAIAPLPDFVKGWLANGMNKQQANKTETIINGVPEGQRNDSAASVAGKLLAKFSKSEWETEAWPLLQGWNSKCMPPLPEDELRAVFDSISSREESKPPVISGKLKAKSKTIDDGPETEEIFTSFFTTADGRIGEQVFDPVKKKSTFAVFDGQAVVYQDLAEDTGRVLRPIVGDNITKGIVKLPTYADEYGTELELFNNIKAFIHTYVDMPDDWEEWSAYYVLLSWVYDKLPVFPYLCALGSSDTGKTRLVQVVGNICYKPVVASGSISASSVFRVLDQFRGTLIINEFDHIGEFDNELIVILNNGYEDGLPVWRVVGEKEKEVRAFNVFGPKLFSTRKRKSDWAFESRLLTIPMKATRRKDIPPFLLDDFYQKAGFLRNMLLSFRLKHYNQEVVFRHDLFTNISGRLRQTLLSVTAVIKDEAFLAKAEQFADKLQKELKAMKGFDLDGTVYQVLVDCWENGDKLPLVKDVAKKVKEIADLEKLSSKTVGNIVRDEFGFTTNRAGHAGNYVIHLSKEQLDSLKDRYEEETAGTPETSSATSASSVPIQDHAEDAELTELASEDREKLEQKTISALNQLAPSGGYQRGYDVAQEVGIPYPWAKKTLELLVDKKKVLQLENQDMWSLTLVTREQLKTTQKETQP